MLSLYVSIWKNNLSFFHKQRGVFVFARRILWWKITWGWIWLASTSSHQETLPVLVSDCESHFSSLFIDGGPMDANQVHALGETVQTWMLKYCSFRHTGWFLYSALWQSDCFPRRYTTSQSLSTCRACSWQEFSGILEFLEWFWKNFQTDRRQRHHLGDMARLCLIVTCNSSLAYVPAPSVWPSHSLKQHPAMPSNRNILLKNK